MPTTDEKLRREDELQATIDAARRAERERLAAETRYQREIAAAQDELQAIARQKAADEAHERQQVYLSAVARLQQAVSDLTACLLPTPDFARAREIARTLKMLYDEAEALRPGDGSVAPWFDPMRPDPNATPAPLALLQRWVESAPAGWPRQERAFLLVAATGFTGLPAWDRALGQLMDLRRI